MKEFFPESLGQKHGCTLYMAKYGNKNGLCNTDVTWQPRSMDQNANA